MSYVGVGNEILLGQSVGGNTYNRESDVVGLASGDYVVVWASGGEGQGQIVTHDGGLDGSTFSILPQVRNIDGPAVAALADGSFIVSWTEQIDSDYAEGQIVGAFFDGGGQQLSYFLGNNETALGQQEASDIAFSSDGSILTVWSSYGTDGTHVVGRNLTSGGSEFRVSPTSDEDVQFLPSLAALRDGRFVVAFTTEDNSEFGVATNTLAADGSSVYQNVNTYEYLYQFRPQVAALANGGYVVTWYDESGSLGDDDFLSVKAQIFAADGARVGSEFLVNTITSGSQTNPVITGLANGGFAIAWQTVSENGDLDIKAQAFDAEGVKVGDEILVNTTTKGDQYDPQIAAGTDGGFIVSWTSGTVNVGSGVTVSARAFEAVDNSGPDIVGTSAGETLTGTAHDESIFGLGGNDRLLGNQGNDALDGGDGADYMAGGKGDDIYHVDELGDAIYEANKSGIDTVISRLKYLLGGNLENLQLVGSGNLSGSGNALDNNLKGNNGSNSLQGLAGNDFIDGGNGNDIINGGAGFDILIGGSGIDGLSYKVGATSGVHVNLSILTSQNTIGSGYDKISGFENLEGTNFSDDLVGDAGANKIIALDGNDGLKGAGGDDDLTGGAGGDSFIFSKASLNGFDTIRDFENGVDGLEFARADYSIAGSRFVFDNASHILYWDSDGDGGASAIALAKIYSSSGTIASHDILIE